jgi:hypothetical protein
MGSEDRVDKGQMFQLLVNEIKLHIWEADAELGMCGL